MNRERGGGCENGEQICVIKCHVSKQTYCNTKGEIGKAVGCEGIGKKQNVLKGTREREVGGREGAGERQR